MKSFIRESKILIIYYDKGKIWREFSIFAIMDNKTLIDRVASESGLRREDVQEMLNSFYSLAAEICVSMDTILIPGFGQFEPKKRKERLTVHPATGKRLLVPPKLVVNFKPSGVMKSNLLNSNGQ